MPFNKRFADTLYNEEWLRREYVEKGRNAAQIASELETNRQTVLDRLRRFGIQVRTVGETQRARTDTRRGYSGPKPKRKFLDTLNNREWLRERYEVRRMSIPQVAKEAGASGPATWAALHRAGLAVRTRSQAAIGRPGSRKPVEELTASGLTARARRACVHDKCVLCDSPGVDVNHKDRSHLNTDPGNLERICRKCHARQHAMEADVAFEWLLAQGITFMDLHVEARARLVALRDALVIPAVDVPAPSR